MLALLAAPLLFSLPSSFSAQATQDEFQRKIGGKDVAYSWPADSPRWIPARSENVDGWTVSIGARGEILGVYRSEPGWAGIRRSYDRIRPQVDDSKPLWRAKAFLLAKTDILNHGEVLRPRRMVLSRPDIDHAIRSLAIYASTVEAGCEGRLRVQVDLEVDDEPHFLDSSPDSVPFDGDWLRDYLEPRINGHDFQADDKVYRGPYDAVFVLHPGLVEPTHRVTVAGMPATSIPVFAAGAEIGPGALARSLVGTFAADALHAAAKHGFRTGGVETLQLSPDEMAGMGIAPWLAAAATVATAPRPDAELARLLAQPSVDGLDWPAIAADPIAALTAITPADLAKIAGAPVEIVPRGAAVLISVQGRGMRMTGPGTSLDALYEPGRESTALVFLGERSLLFVESSAAPLFANRLAGRHIRAHGYVGVAGRHHVLLSLDTPEAGTQEAELLGLARAAPSAAAPESGETLFSGSAEHVVASGYFQGKAANDPARGPITELLAEGPIRLGRAVLFDRYRDGRSWDVKQRPVLKLWLKSANPEPLVFRIASDTPAWQGAAFRVFGRWPVVEESNPEPMTDAFVPADGEWHEVAIDLRAVGPMGGQMFARSLTVESDPMARLWSPRALGVANVWIGAVTVASAGANLAKPDEGPSAEAPSPTAADKDARARWAAQVDGSKDEDVQQLIGLLKDRSDLVRLNAVAAFRRIRYPKAEPALADAILTLDPRIAQQGILALEHQGTEYSWAAIQRQLVGAVTDAHRLFAVRAMKNRKDGRSAGVVSGLYSSRSRQVRKGAAEALAALTGRDAELLVVVFLHESEAEVRLAATRLANPDNETVCRRLLYSSVNDASEAVRAASSIRLIQSSLKNFRDEGCKGVRDDSLYVKTAVLSYLQKNPTEEARQALRLAVVDGSPIVRAAALRAFATLPGPVARDEVASVFNDRDPRVAAALAELKAAKGIGDVGLAPLW